MSIIVDNLTISYRSRPAVHHAPTESVDQSMWAVLGPNGAGKSALLKAVMGLQKADTGCVRRIRLKRGDIAYLPQQSETNRGQLMTVFELAAMGLWYEIGFFDRVNAGQRQRVFDTLERVEIADPVKQQIIHLSSGQFQHALLARILVQGTKFLLLGGPFNAADAKTTCALLGMLATCHVEGQVMVAMLHDCEQARARFVDTLPLACEKTATGTTEAVLIGECPWRADTAMQRHGSAG